MVFVTYNSDLGDAGEWMDDPEYPALFHWLRLPIGPELHHLRDDPLIPDQFVVFH